MTLSQIDRYQILGLLGQGGMGKVYRAHDPDLDREVVLKIINLPESSLSDEWRQRFRHEVRATARLNHPNIVTVYDVGLDHDPPYVVMELLSGGTLRDRLQPGPLSWPQALTTLRPLAEALAYAHSAGVIHRDVKPANIMFTGDETVPPGQEGAGGVLKLVDYGLARQQESEPVTHAGTVFGTPAYMSPEQASGEVIDTRTDIFSLGIILFETIAGHNPLAGGPVAVEEPIDLSPLTGIAPQDVIRLIERAVANKREDRYQTCEALLADLDHCLSNSLAEPSASLPTSYSQRSATGPLATAPIIQKPRDIDLSPAIKRVLRAMFAEFSRIAIEAEYVQGLSGGRVFQVLPIDAEGKARLPSVIKVAPLYLIQQEWQAYQTWVADQLPGAARLESAPTLPPGSLWDGLRYSFFGGGAFKVETLYSYYQRASAKNLRWVLAERLYQLLGVHWWLEHRLDRAFQMQADYDTILPVNLILKPVDLPADKDVLRIDPGHLPPSSLPQGGIVRLEEFVVTEVDPNKQQMTLNVLPTSPELPSTAYRLRLVEVANLDGYRVGQVIDSLAGQVIATRQDLLAAEASRTLGAEIDLSAEPLNVPAEHGMSTPSFLASLLPASLPNPLLAYQAMLDAFMTVNISTIHGDLNLENILIDPETRHISLIDFATVRQGHSLHDLLRLETEVLTKLIAAVLAEANLPSTVIHALYQQLHLTTIQPGRSPLFDDLPQALRKPYVMLTAIRKMARTCMFNPDDWTEYYQGLTLYLLGALKFKNLDRLPSAPMPKQVAFWGAATLVDLLNRPVLAQETLVMAGSQTSGRAGYADKDLSTIARKVAAIIQETEPRRHEQQDRLYISYKRNIEPDQRLAAYLYEFLNAQGQEVFVDQAWNNGGTPPDLTDQRIKGSDVLVALLSEESLDSEMVQAEVRRAYKYLKSQGHPRILPVRMAYNGLFPYSIDAFLDPLQYLVWHDEADNERIGQEILAALAGRLPQRTPIQAEPADDESIISEDGSLVLNHDELSPPLPACDPRLIEELEAPGGAVKLRDKFYIGRDADKHLKRQIIRAGTISTVRAPRQSGKSSLLVRGVHYARQNGAKVVHLDLQRVDRNVLNSPDPFLRYLAEFIVRKLRYNVATVDKMWSSSQGPQEKLTYLLEDFVLPACDTPIVLAIDEADSLTQTSFQNDFFGMVRSWHNSAAYDEQWEKLNIVLAISTEPYLLIPDFQQSPFNVGLKLYLEDFSESQVRDLNWRHGSPVQDNDFPDMMSLLNGHPYLTRKALYAMVTENLTWPELRHSAVADDGIFGDHLRRHHWLLRDEPELIAALKQIIEQNQCANEGPLFRLQRAGLVQRDGDTCACRCTLYSRYFEDKL